MEQTNPLFRKADTLAKKVYKITISFPKHEIYGLTSQLRRAALSVILNVIEGFARQSVNEYHRFLLIAFGSLKETKYLLHFAYEQAYLDDASYNEVHQISEEVARILWSIINPRQGAKNN